MFRRLPTSLPLDPVAPADLEKLGYFINTNDQIRMISDPEQKYLLRINRNERVNDVYKEAMNTCIREIVYTRLHDLGLETRRLPVGAKQNDRHVPIMMSKDLKMRKRVLVVFSERGQDLGIFSYRAAGDNSLKTGSAIEMVEAVLRERHDIASSDLPGVILTNPGQLIWYRGGGRAVGDREWLNLKRASAVHEPFRIDPIKNRVPGNTTYSEHVQYIFETIMQSEVHADAKFDIIGLEYTGMATMEYLSDHWSEWKNRINGICLGNPQHVAADLQNPEFVGFLGKRARAYFLSDARIESVMSGRKRVGCNCYASGEEYYEEAIVVKGWRSMLDWFNMIYDLKDYEEPAFEVIQE